MAQGLLERVRFLGGDGPTPDQPVDELPPLDLGPDALEPDPQPAPETRKGRPKSEVSKETAAKQGRAGGRFVSSAKQQQQIADEIDMWIKTFAAVWALSDETCSGALNETSSVIAADLARLVGRSEWLTEQVHNSGLLGDILRTLMHISPLLKVMWRHHGSRQMDEGQGDEHEPVQVEPDGMVDVSRYGPWRPDYAA